MVVNGDGKLLFGRLLPDHVFIQEGLNFLRFWKLVGSGGGWCCGAIIFQNRITDRYALIANIGSRIIAGGRNQLGHCVLRLMAERTAQHLLGACPIFHSAYSLELALAPEPPYARRTFFPPRLLGS